MKKFTPIWIIVMLMLVCSVTAITSLGNFKQNDCVDLIQVCADCTYNNITSVLYPNSSLAMHNTSGTISMLEFTEGEFKWVNFCNTSLIGRYIVNGVGNIGGTQSSWGYDFYITTTGGSDTYNNFTFFIVEGILIILLVLNMLGFGALQKLWQRAALIISMTIILTTIMRFTAEIMTITNPYATGMIQWIETLYSWGTISIYLSVIFGMGVVVWYALHSLSIKRKQKSVDGDL